MFSLITEANHVKINLAFSRANLLALATSTDSIESQLWTETNKLKGIYRLVQSYLSILSIFLQFPSSCVFTEMNHAFERQIHFDPDFLSDEVDIKLAQVDSLAAEVILPDSPTKEENKNNFKRFPKMKLEQN